LARVFVAPCELNGTVLATVLRRTFTEIPSLLIYASPVNTRLITLALIDVHLTVVALKAILALAMITADLVHAGAVQTRAAVTLSDVLLTVVSRRARYAHTCVP